MDFVVYTHHRSRKSVSCNDLRTLGQNGGVYCAAPHQHSSSKTVFVVRDSDKAGLLLPGLVKGHIQSFMLSVAAVTNYTTTTEECSRIFCSI